MRILITNPGRKNYFINFLLEIKRKYLKNLKIHLSDADVNSSTFNMNLFVKTHVTPKCKNKKKYFNSIIKIVKKNKIDLIIPLTDLDLDLLSKKKTILDKIKCKALISNIQVINICNNKTETYGFLKRHNFLTPLTWTSKKKLINKFPVVAKYKSGNSSEGFQLISTHKQLKFINMKKNIFQKYVKGKEYHLDILNDFNGKYLDHCSKLKIEMRDGETFKAKIVKNRKLDLLCKRISKTLKHIGNLDCDVILNKNSFYIIDFNPRFGGGYPFTHLSGKNYIYKILSLLINKKYKIKKNPNLITAMKSLNLNIKK